MRDAKGLSLEFEHVLLKPFTRSYHAPHAPEVLERLTKTRVIIAKKTGMTLRALESVDLRSPNGNQHVFLFPFLLRSGTPVIPLMGP